MFYVPPLGWLGVMIIVFCLRATPWLARGYYYRFLVVIECVSNFWCVCVYFFARWGSIPQRSWCLVTLLFIGEPNHKTLHSALGWIRCLVRQTLHRPHGSLAVRLKHKKQGGQMASFCFA